MESLVSLIMLRLRSQALLLLALVELLPMLESRSVSLQWLMLVSWTELQLRQESETQLANQQLESSRVVGLPLRHSVVWLSQPRH